MAYYVIDGFFNYFSVDYAAKVLLDEVLFKKWKKSLVDILSQDLLLDFKTQIYELFKENEEYSKKSKKLLDK